MNYPSSLMAIEKEIKLGELKKRFDILVYKDALPWLMVECKEMNVPINEAVLKQVLNYNISLEVPYILITNGNHSFAYELSNGTMQQILSIPNY